MEVLERAIYMSIGGGIGFILGYIAALLRTIKTKVECMEKEVHEVHEHEIGITLKDEREKNDDGFLKMSAVNVMMALVLVITVYAAFAASKTNSDLDDTLTCLTRFNSDQNAALVSRDLAIKVSSDAEIELWGLYNVLYAEADSKNVSAKRLNELQDELAKAIREYRLKLVRTQMAREIYEYGEPDILKNCEQKEHDK